MKAFNDGKEIIIKGSFFEIATLVTIIDDYIKRNPDESLPREISNIIHNPKNIKNY